MKGKKLRVQFSSKGDGSTKSWQDCATVLDKVKDVIFVHGTFVVTKYLVEILESPDPKRIGKICTVHPEQIVSEWEK